MQGEFVCLFSPPARFLTVREELCYSPRTVDIQGFSTRNFSRNTV
jgi:hypothetical protein